ncbi:MAG: YybH family protein [Planctomycetota bacterium]
MKRPHLFATTLAVVLAAIPSMAQDAAEAPASPAAASAAESRPSPSDDSRDSASELSAIRAASQAFADAFNKHDAEAVAAHWTKEGDYVDESGRRFAGRDAIQQAYAAFFAEEPQARMRVEIDSLSPDGRA